MQLVEVLSFSNTYLASFLRTPPPPGTEERGGGQECSLGSLFHAQGARSLLLLALETGLVVFFLWREFYKYLLAIL